jgi:uncharacterized protein YPO0396
MNGRTNARKPNRKSAPHKICNNRHKPCCGNNRGYCPQFDLLEAMREEALGGQVLTVESCDNRERDMRDWLQARIDAEDSKIKRLSEKIIKAMTEYKRMWPLETREVDVNLAAGPRIQVDAGSAAGR